MGAALDDSANVPRPTASAFIWQNPKSTLRHPPQRPRQRASVVRALRIPILQARSGGWGTQRSGIKEESAGRGTAAELSATAARSTLHAERS